MKANFFAGNYKQVVWVIGDGRSGTTWLTSLINHHQQYRVMFEPFHPEVLTASPFYAHKFLSSNADDRPLQEMADRIFSGEFTHSRVDIDNRRLSYQGLLIKDIFANLFAHWTINHNPAIKPILIIRHPMAVAVSKGYKSTGRWEASPDNFTEQSSLYSEYLAPFTATIKWVVNQQNELLNYILTWCIVNYVPLRQFKTNELHVCFYEHLFLDPPKEISEIYRFINQPINNGQDNIPKSLINKPSRVVFDETQLSTNQSPIMAWQKELSTELIEQAESILKAFGLDDLYDSQGLPNPRVIDSMLSNN